MKPNPDQSRASSSRTLGTGAAMLLAAAAAVLVYSASLPGTFQYDDLPTIVQNEAVRDPGLAAEYFVDPDLFSGIPGNRMYRPVLMLTYLANYGLAGYEPLTWHLTNVFLHGLNAALVVLLSFQLAGVFAMGRARVEFALLAGLAFGLHPLHSEVVNYVSSRSGAIATAGFLGALLLHLAWTRSGRGRLLRGLALAGSVFAFLAGLGGKEIAIALVPTVTLLELLDPAPGRWRRAVVRTVPVLLAAALYLQVRVLVMETSAFGNIAERVVSQKTGGDVYSGGGRTPWENLLTQSRVFWMYMGLCVLPVGLTVDRFVRVSASLAEPMVLVSIAGMLLVLWLLWRERERRPLLTFGGLLVFFGLAPTSSLLPLNVVMNEHRMYLPGVGVALLMGWGAAALKRLRPRAGMALLVAVAASFAGIAVQRSLVWQDSRALWESAVRVSPLSYRAWNQLGSEIYGEAARIGSVPEAVPLLDQAIARYERAVELYPDWYDPHLNLGIAFRERARVTGDEAEWRRSIREFERCLEIVPQGWRARYQISTTYGAWERYDEAIAGFAEMAAADRKDDGRRLPIYLFPMARLERDRGRHEEAEGLYREILLVAPDDPDAHLGVALCLADSARAEEAVDFLRQYVRRRPDDPRPRLVFADYLLARDPPDRKGAAMLFQQAVRLGYRPVPGDLQKYVR